MNPYQRNPMAAVLGTFTRLAAAQRTAVHGMLAASVLALAGCTHMDHIVVDVQLTAKGSLAVTTCDEKIYWDVLILVWGEGDCHKKIKQRPARPQTHPRTNTPGPGVARREESF